MTSQAGFALRGRNPDVLTCIANLSNDEVFTPPEFANQMLDNLAEAWAADHNGANIWADKHVTFLDPFTKSGVFLREIASRLIEGLSEQIPDLQARVDHILSTQVFGVAITQLTSLLARRSLYCSKLADSEHSVSSQFSDSQGNVWFKRTEHTWNETKCVFCGAPKAVLDRDKDIENYAYAFIHTDNVAKRLAEMFGGRMQFDVVIGNPPYQMKGGAGGTSDASIYHLFVEQAQKLEPRYLSMVIPSRWLAGGRGMDGFRKEMLGSGKLAKIVDFPVSSEVFPNVEVKGGVCYFLWKSDMQTECDVTIVRGDQKETALRRLDEFDVFVRDPKAVSILRKVLNADKSSITDILTADTPFGIATNFEAFRLDKNPGDATLHFVRQGKRLTGYLAREGIKKNSNLIDFWKVLVPEAGSDGGQKIPDVVLGRPLIVAPGSICTQSFLAFWVSSEAEANSLYSYIGTKFFRFFVSLRKITQHALRSTYTWVPMQTWTHAWTDGELYKKYDLTESEIDYIETVIKHMKLEEFGNDA